MALRLGVDLKLFDAIAVAAQLRSTSTSSSTTEDGCPSSSRPSFTLSELCDSLPSHADPVLVRKLSRALICICIILTPALGRIVRFLAAMEVLLEVEPEHFVSTPLAETLVSSSSFAAAVIHR